MRTHVRKAATKAGQKADVSKGKAPISNRKLQANRANAKRSTGPRTAKGKAVSRRNALKHGILSRAIDVLPAAAETDLRLLNELRPLVSRTASTESALQDISRIWQRMARLVEFENRCMQGADGINQHGRLIHRYERMLSGQLHARIRESSGIEGKVSEVLRKEVL